LTTAARGRICHRMVTYNTPIAARRDPEETKSRILNSLAHIIVRDGLGAVGVNTLARAAGADKVLIYRYFGDLDGVYAAFAERADFWWTCVDLVQGVDPATTSLAEAIKICLRRHALEIRKRPVTLAVLAAEPAQRTPLVVALETVRERRALELMAWLGARYAPPQGLDLEAISLILSAAINYLAARSRKIRMMSGVPIQTDEDWRRLSAAVDRIVEGLFAGV
jgi:AcrR family transcriptional regulator